LVPAESSPFFTIPQPFSKLHDTKGLGTSFDVTHPGFILLDAVEVAGGDQMLEIPYDMGQWLGVRKRTHTTCSKFYHFRHWVSAILPIRKSATFRKTHKRTNTGPPAASDKTG
jgi:hypothetical protein